MQSGVQGSPLETRGNPAIHNLWIERGKNLEILKGSKIRKPKVKFKVKDTAHEYSIVGIYLHQILHAFWNFYI